MHHNLLDNDIRSFPMARLGKPLESNLLSKDYLISNRCLTARIYISAVKKLLKAVLKHDKYNR